jgi:hypothetical protein
VVAGTKRRKVKWLGHAIKIDLRRAHKEIFKVKIKQITVRPTLG